MTNPGPAHWRRFGEKVRLALDASKDASFESGTSGLEVEYNILDERLEPVLFVGYGPERRSFADYLHEDRLPEFVRDRFQLEVFHWMTEVATRPYYSPWGAAAEARLLEAALLNTVADISLSFGEPLVLLNGNIPADVAVSEESIPGGWNLAHTRYLAHCVALFGRQLATAGVHTNHSFPEALLSWDFVHLSLSEREGQTLEHYRNAAVIRATRLLRPFCPLFTAVSAASPLTWELVDGAPEVVLTEVESQRLLTFPNPANLDVAGLYASHDDYLRISYNLVRSGVRFGGNNWTPVRARSDIDPVNRNILATSADLRELYRRGIYSGAEMGGLEEAERALMVEHLCARVDLPMNRVEVRTDEGGDSLELAVAKVAFKELLMLRIYGDPGYGADYAYGGADIARARRNEAAAARLGLAAEVEHPFTGERVGVREWLGATLTELRPLAEALGYADSLEPLGAMAGGGPSPASELRGWLQARLHGPRHASSGALVVPRELVLEWIAERNRRVAAEASDIAARAVPGGESAKLAGLMQGLREQGRTHVALPVRLERPATPLIASAEGVLGEVLELAAELVRIPSVTNCPDERTEEVGRCGRVVAGWLSDAGARVRLFDGGRYPSVLASFPGARRGRVVLSGHFDVVRPEPDDSQFEPHVEGDYLWGRGAADMKTVVATFMVWMRRALAAGPPWPPVSLLLVGNEENGEQEPFGTPHVLADLVDVDGWLPELMIVGERTGERGDETMGEVCTANRGVVRFRVVAHGQRRHTGTGGPPQGLLDRLLEARDGLMRLFSRHLTISSFDGWESAARFPFLNAGEAGVYNITAAQAVLGAEVRPIPDDDLIGLMGGARALCHDLALDLEVEVSEGGVACPAENPHLGRLLQAVAAESRAPARVGRKLAGTSARFAPGGNAVVWGQSGIGPHARDERHYIPSIEPYFNALSRFAAESLAASRSEGDGDPD